MKTCYVTIAAAALLLSLPAFADDNGGRTRDSTIIHRDEMTRMHRNEQGDVNANDPSSSHRALGRERAEERHDMKDHDTLRGAGGTSGEEEHHTLRRDTKRLRDEGGTLKRRMETERHEGSTER